VCVCCVVYIRRVLAGEFVCVNNHLLRDLIRLKLWNPVCLYYALLFDQMRERVCVYVSVFGV